MLDIQDLINSMGLTADKSTSVYLINEEIQRVIRQQAALKKVHGIFYIVSNISESLYTSLNKRIKNWPEIDHLVLIDNGQFPNHTEVMHLFNEVIFYERFKRNKIIVCQNINSEESEDSLLTKALNDINSSTYEDEIDD